ncbi:methylated-DNA--[protein]-cysteine S-methyltransferase [Chloroflexota bacterium]
MSQDLSYIVFDTAAGWMGILGSPCGLLRTTLPQQSVQGALQILGKDINRASEAPNLFHDLIQRFKAYFDGKITAFPDRLDISEATPFQRSVWEADRLIPYGETRSYGWIAQQIGNPKSGRAVGNALGKNPLPIIVPCHRVLAGDGRLGGFTGGLETKKQLLRLEGSTYKNTTLCQS